MSIFEYGLTQLIDILPKCGRKNFSHHGAHSGSSRAAARAAGSGRRQRWFWRWGAGAQEEQHEESILEQQRQHCDHIDLIPHPSRLTISPLRSSEMAHTTSITDDFDDCDDKFAVLHHSRRHQYCPNTQQQHHHTPQACRPLLTDESRTSSVYMSASDLPFTSTSSGAAGAAAAHSRSRPVPTSDCGANMELQQSTDRGNNHDKLSQEETSFSYTLRDGVRSIDFVIVWQDEELAEYYQHLHDNGDQPLPESPVTPLSPQQQNKHQQKRQLIDLHKKRRTVFEGNLTNEGLVLEEDHVAGVPLRFVKIHAPMEVCCRYAEILKLRLPMKEKLDEYFLKKRFVIHLPGLPSFELTVPNVLHDVTDGVSRLFNFVRNNPKHFPQVDRRFTATYSRDREYLFDMSHDFFNASNRARIIDFILRRKKFCGDGDGGDEFSFGIEKLLSDSTYEAAYPIHEGDYESGDNARAVLYKHWASVRNIYKYQPLDHIRDYFGVKIALYFAWLGFYTYMLIPASVVGFLCFVYAASTINYHQPSNDICNGDLGTEVQMCPLCDQFCDYWSLSETCFHAKFTYLVDNPGTVFFAVFMSFWAALFLELWKRYSAEISHRWDLTGFDIQEEHPRPQYLARLAHVKKKTINIVTKTVEPQPPFWRMRVPGLLFSASSVMLLVMMAFVAVVAVILYRMSMLAALSIHGDTILTSYAIIFTSTTAAFINLVCIMVFNQVYARMAEYLTEKELQRTQTEFDDSLTLKIYLLQFVNYYSSIFYIAFFKGKLVGYPGKYNRFFSSRQEECSPGGCLLELSVQLAIIMVGKQAMNTVVEMILPKIRQWYSMFTVPQDKREVHSRWPQWARDFKLIDFGPRGLFPEYLEMVLQYGFVTLFVSSFPLAPLFAFVNNMLEVRLDAKKLLTNYRRPVAQRVKDIGVWFRILDSIGKFAVITNAFIIAFTSNFIPELVYTHVVSEDNTLRGFLNYTLSVFDVSDYPAQYRPSYDSNQNITVCRYPDYRNPPGHHNEYKYAPIFWHILAARLAFVVVFENVVCIVILLVKWFIPDMPYRLKEQIRREAYMTNELIVEQELEMARGVASLDEVTENLDEEMNDTSGNQQWLRRRMSAPAFHSRTRKKQKEEVNDKLLQDHQDGKQTGIINEDQISEKVFKDL